MVNTSPIFTVSGDINWTPSPIINVVTGSTSAAYDGTSGTVLIHTALADGSFVQKLVCEAFGTNIAAVLRIYINNGGTTATASNNVLYYQYSLPATTQSATIATAHIEIPLNIQLPAGYRIYAGISCTANLASGWMVTAVGGDY